jgi:hypothetical protein
MSFTSCNDPYNGSILNLMHNLISLKFLKINFNPSRDNCNITYESIRLIKLSQIASSELHHVKACLAQSNKTHSLMLNVTSHKTLKKKV